MTILRWMLALAMVAVGALHFVAPRGFESIVPKALPAPRLLVYLSGVAEIALGLGLLFEATQSWAAWGLIALYVAVFPANINQAINRLPFGKAPVAPWVLWARLPLQGVFIAWASLFT